MEKENLLPGEPPIPESAAQEKITPPPVPVKFKSNIGFKIQIIVAALIFVLIFAGVGYTAYTFIHSGPKEEVACTLEAKICPDGSSVGRTGPQCEFAPCP